MRVLRAGVSGPDVGHWQAYLRGLDIYKGVIDDSFGPETSRATKHFQKVHALDDDGVVGKDTYSVAMASGFDPVVDDDEGRLGPNWPPKPDFSPLRTDEERAILFDHFRYRPAGDPKDPERIIVTDNWVQHNIVMAEIPQLKSASKGHTKFAFHRLVVDQVQKLFSTWEEEGLAPLILTWAGSYAARFVRGGRSLSNHAFGTAFDINVAWNGLGKQPSLVGQRGSVRELVPIANELGFYWGGHFSRKDGMHFEVAVLA